MSFIGLRSAVIAAAAVGRGHSKTLYQRLTTPAAAAAATGNG